MMIALLLLALLVAAGIAVALGWTADSRDDGYKLWPLEGTRSEKLVPAHPGPDDVRGEGRRPAAPEPTLESISRRTIGRAA